MAKDLEIVIPIRTYYRDSPLPSLYTLIQYNVLSDLLDIQNKYLAHWLSTQVNCLYNINYMGWDFKKRIGHPWYYIQGRSEKKNYFAENKGVWDQFQDLKEKHPSTNNMTRR